jgi:hypothetical protein
MLYLIFAPLVACSGDQIEPTVSRSEIPIAASLENTQLSAAPINRDDCPTDYPIKGNIRIDKIFHIPGGRYYNVTDPEECFSDSSAAISAGFRHSKR